MTLSVNHPEGESTSSLSLVVKEYSGLQIHFWLLSHLLLPTGSSSESRVRSVVGGVFAVDLSRTQLHTSRQAGSPATWLSE